MKIAFPTAKWTSPYIEAADSQKERRTFSVTALLCCSAPVNKAVPEPCYPLVPQPKLWTFWAMSQSFAPEGTGEDTLATVTDLLLLSLGIILFVRPTANACVSRCDYTLLLQPQWALRH